MFAEVILHRRVPSRFESFTYQIPEGMRVEPGQIVRVPFRKSVMPAMVRSLHEKTPPYAVKSLQENRPLVLPQRQMQLAAWMAQRYAAPFAKVLDLFIPEKIWEPAKTARQKTAVADTPPLAARPKRPSGDAPLESFIKKLLANAGANPGRKFIFEKTPFPRKEFYGRLAAESSIQGQMLFLFPEFFHSRQLAGDLPVFHGSQNENEKALLWEAVRMGGLKVVAGTRPALFLPFKNLSLIVLDFEEHDSYDEIRQPSYHGLDVAEKLAQLWSATLIVMSCAPRVETFAAAKQRYQTAEWNEPGKKTAVTLIPLADERKCGNNRLLAGSVVEKMAGCLAQKKQVLLLLNRTGEASALLCRDCGKIFRCPACSSALAVHRDMELQCHRCRTRQPIPAACDICGNAKLKALGAGTQGLEKEVRNIFAKADILRLDRETMTDLRKTAALPHRLAACDIIIATQAIVKPFDLPRLALALAALPDPLLHFPDFRATQRVFQLLTHIRLLAAKGEFIIQTFLPDHKLFGYLQKNMPEAFYEEELASRKMLNLPPFGTSSNQIPTGGP